MRTSAAAGAAGFILLGDAIDPFDPGAVRATMGALFKQTIVRASAENHGILAKADANWAALKGQH